VKVTREKTENSQAFLAIEMDPEEVEESLEKAYRRLRAKTNVPGFRKGKIPRDILERYVGKDSLLEEALNHLLPEAYDKAVKEQEIDAIAPPKIELAQSDPVIFKAVVPLRPDIELGDYHQIRMKPEVEEVTEDKINAVMEELRHQYATWEPAERPVGFGDMVFLSVESSVEGEPFMNSSGVQYPVVRDAMSPVPGFAEKLEGMKSGEEREFNLKVPEDYTKKELAGKEAAFKVKIIEAKAENLPELNDDFAKQVNPEFTTLEALREQIAASLRQGAEENARADFERRLVEAVAELTKVEFPPFFVDEEIEHLFMEQTRRLQMGQKGLEDYLKGINKTEGELREDLRPIATKRVTNALLLGMVADKEKIEVSDAEIDAEVESMVNTVPEKADKDKIRENLNIPQSRDSIRQMLATRKTIEKLSEIAQGSPAEKKKGKEAKK